MKQLRFGLFVLALTFLLLLPGARSGKTQEGKWLLRYIVSGENALLFNRPELVCGGEVRRMEWSPDGNFAVAVSEVAPPADPNRPPGISTANVTVWRRDIHRARLLWSAPFTKWDIARSQENANWFANTAVYLLHIEGTDTRDAFASHLLMLTPLRDTAREIPTNGPAAVQMNPAQPFALIEEAQMQKTTDPPVMRYSLLHADGTRQETRNAPATNLTLNAWAPDGKTFYAFVPEPRAGSKYTHYALDTATGEWKEIEAKPDFYLNEAPAAPKSDLRIVRTTGSVELDGEKRTVHPAWLATSAKSGPPRSLIAADCEEAILSPKGDAVLYRTKEGAFVLPLTKVSAAPFAEMLKKTVMSNAKQIGLGLIMYVQDYDEEFPLAQFDIKDVVNPYVKNSDLFEGFTYSYPAKSLANIDKPAETIIGTVAGPGGEAVIYADGHVKWRDKK